MLGHKLLIAHAEVILYKIFIGNAKGLFKQSVEFLGGHALEVCRELQDQHKEDKKEDQGEDADDKTDQRKL